MRDGKLWRMQDWIQMIMIFRIAGGISEQAGKETRERFTRQYLQIYKRQR
jgi:hypothetical protein